MRRAYHWAKQYLIAYHSNNIAIDHSALVMFSYVERMRQVETGQFTITYCYCQSPHTHTHSLNTNHKNWNLIWNKYEASPPRVMCVLSKPIWNVFWIISKFQLMYYWVLYQSAQKRHKIQEYKKLKFAKLKTIGYKNKYIHIPHFIDKFSSTCEALAPIWKLLMLL